MTVASLSSSRHLVQLRPGEIIGSYQLLCPVAHGGMGQVWAARRTTRLGVSQLVAIKTTSPDSGVCHEMLTDLLFDEARIAASIDHPNVCKVYELGEDRGILFMAMEWIHGASLSRLIKSLPSRRLAFDLAAYIVAQSCSGLHAAHELKGEDGLPLDVVHRDATPQNILVSTAGEVKIVDFGVVKSRDQVHQKTIAGEVKGKLSYMAPEQLRSQHVDRRADVFALGGVLYYLTTGTRAFRGDSPGATMSRILEGEYTPPSDCVENYPKELEDIVVRALAKQAEDRYQTADEMRVALQSFLSSSASQIGRLELGEFVTTVLGQQIEEQRQEIRNIRREFEAQSSSGISLLPSVSDSCNLKTLSRASGPAARTPSNAPTALNQHGPIATLTRKLRTFTSLQSVRLAAASLAGLAVAALVSSAVQKPPARASSAAMEAPNPAAAPLQPSAADRPQAIAIDITTLPASAKATISIDDGPELSSPLAATTSKDNRVHRVHVQAPKYLPVSKEITFDRDQRLSIELTPEPPESQATRPIKRPKQPTRLSRAVEPAEPSRNEPPAVSSAAIGATESEHATEPATPRLRERPHHAIDPTDPFASPR